VFRALYADYGCTNFVRNACCGLVMKSQCNCVLLIVTVFTVTETQSLVATLCQNDEYRPLNQGH